MTVLTVAQRVGRRVGISIGTSLYGSSVEKVVALRELIEDSAEFILADHDWELLQTKQTMTGDGATSSYALPSDYDRMLTDAKIYSSGYEAPLHQIKSYDHWLELEVQAFDFVVNAWTMYGNQIHIKPDLASGVTAEYIYISNKFARDSGDTAKNGFSADTDTFKVTSRTETSEQLLRYCTIWKWKAENEIPYEQDFAIYSNYRDKITGADQAGPKLLHVGRPRILKGVRVGYPQNITAT